MKKDEFIARVKEVDFGGCPHCLLKTVMEIWTDLSKEELDAADFHASVAFPKSGGLMGHELGGAIVMAQAFVKALSETIIENGADAVLHTQVLVHMGLLLMKRSDEIRDKGALANDMLQDACGGVK